MFATRTRVWAAAFLALASALPAAASTSTAGEADGQLTLQTNGSGVATFHLNHALRHSVSDRDLQVQIHGPGRFLGLVVLPHARPLSAGTTGLVMGSLPGSARPHPTVIIGNGRSPLPDTLPAGDYDGYVAADGPVTVGITLPGDSERIAVRARSTNAIKELSYDAALPGRVTAAPTFSAGANLQSQGSGGMFSVAFIWRRAVIQTSSIQGACLYPGGAPAQADYAVPACPDGDGAELDGFVDLRTPANTLGLSWVHLPRGTWGLKDYYTAAAAPRAAGIVFLNIGSV